MDPDERRMWLKLDRNRLMPRAVKEAFAHEFARGNMRNAALITIGWEAGVGIIIGCLVGDAINWVLA